MHRSYLSYLLRLRGEVNQGWMLWRASLESVQSGEHREFASVEQLFTYLRADLQTEKQRVAVVITATIQVGKVDEVHILWRTSLASTLKTLPGLSYASLFVDRVNHGLLVIAYYATRQTGAERWDGDQWQTICAPLATVLELNSIGHTAYEITNFEDM